jgi:hypothetical protein
MNGKMTKDIQEIESLKKQPHRVFECNGTSKYEDWCEDEDCSSADGRNRKTYNQAIDDCLNILKN